jgi:DNA-binding transcriptional MerR regulator
MATKPAKGEMTIRELADRTGMTVRNIRAHQARGLLPPPVVRGRTGFYNADHVSRIELTREMQADGLNLEAIRRVLESDGGAAGEIFDFSRAIRVPFEDETPEIYEAAELADTWGAERTDPELIAQGERLGILRALPDGRIEVISPRMQEAAVELAKLGIGAEAAMATAEKLRGQAEGSARAFVDLFVKEIWEPFDRAGRPEGDWPRIREALDRLRPLASTTVLAVFQIAMDEAMERSSERTLRLGGSKAPKKRKQGTRRGRR